MRQVVYARMPGPGDLWAREYEKYCGLDEEDFLAWLDQYDRELSQMYIDGEIDDSDEEIIEAHQKWENEENEKQRRVRRW